MFDIQKMMKQAQKMQDQMKSVQEELEKTEFTGTSGGGAVTVTLNGKYVCQKVTVKPEALEDAGMLEDLIQSAFNDAGQKISGAMESKMKSVTNGLNIPGLNLPF